MELMQFSTIFSVVICDINHILVIMLENTFSQHLTTARKITTGNIKLRTIQCAGGQLTLQENGIIYFYKKDDLVTDVRIASEIIESIRRLDNSGLARVLVIQGWVASYTFEAQKLYFQTDVVKKSAIVCKNGAQEEVARLNQKMSKTFKASFEVGVFRLIEEAENWLQS